MPSLYDAPAPRPVKILDFAKLGRPYEQDRRIQPGDVLEVACSNLLSESKIGTVQVRVNSDGSATLPLLPNQLRLDSLTCGEAEQVVSTAYRAANLISRPNPTIKILEFNKKKIYLVGAVKNPGMYELRPDECNPLRAILAAGGLTEDAGAVVEVRRTSNAAPPKRSTPTEPGSLVVRPSDWAVDASPSSAVGNGPLVRASDFAEDRQEAKTRSPGASLAAAVGRGRVVSASEFAADTQEGATRAPADAASRSEDAPIRFDLSGKTLVVRPDQLVLDNGDVVSVEEKKKQALFVTGSVKKPGEFPMPTDREIHVLEAVGMAGGVNTLSQPTHVLITRRLENHDPVILSVDLQHAGLNPKENIRLMAGDVVNVEENWASQTRRFFREFIKLGLNGAVPGLN